MKQHEIIRTKSSIWFRASYESNLKSRAVNVMSCLITYMNTNDNTCFPSIKTIAKCCSISVNTVKRALDDLVDAGFVEKESRFIEAKNGAQTSNLYHLSAVFAKAEPQQEEKPVTEQTDKEYEVISFEDLKNEDEPSTPQQEQSTDTLITPTPKKHTAIIGRADRTISKLRRSVNVISSKIKKTVPITQLSCVPP